MAKPVERQTCTPRAESPVFMSRTTLGFLLGFLGVVAFGGTFPMTRLAVQWFDPLFVTFWRPGLAGLLALALLLVLRRPIPGREALMLMAISTSCIVWGFPGLVNLAMTLMESSNAGVIGGILPMATAVAAALILRERQPLSFWVVALLGMTFVVGFAMRGGGRLAPGDLIMIVAVAIAGIGYVLSAKLSRTMPGWEVISWILVIALPVNIVGMLWTWPPANGPGSFAGSSMSALAGFAYVTVISQYVGFFAWNAGLAMGGVARVGQVQLLQTFITLIFAAVIVGETVEPIVWGSAVVVVALVFAAKRVAR
ncbi:MAG: DMT family transporter [Bosea sp. (in: a-proteobacteria)]